MLIPRVALTGTGDATTIPSPATSLLVYNTAAAGSGTTAVVPGYYYWDGSWVRMVAQKGGAVPFADFYALMPPDNPSVITSYMAIAFPRTTITNSIITRINSSQFNLPDIATYEVTFQVSINERAQLAIMLNGTILASSIVGRDAGSSQLIGTYLVTTTAPNSILSIVNPPDPFGAAFTLTPNAGGTNPVSAHLIIKKLN
jgi:hypothetical protein